MPVESAEISGCGSALRVERIWFAASEARAGAAAIEARVRSLDAEVEGAIYTSFIEELFTAASVTAKWISGRLLR